MVENRVNQPTTDWLETKSQVKERPFTSTTPLIGKLIVRFRTAWNSVAAKWYVRSLLIQQNAFNGLVAKRLYDLDSRLITQDREQTKLVHDTAELTTQLIQMNRLLQTINERLARLETDQ